MSFGCLNGHHPPKPPAKGVVETPVAGHEQEHGKVKGGGQGRLQDTGKTDQNDCNLVTCSKEVSEQRSFEKRKLKDHESKMLEVQCLSIEILYCR